MAIITFDLPYVSLGNISVGDIIVGVNSGATGKVESITATKFVLSNATGIFQTNEAIYNFNNPVGVLWGHGYWDNNLQYDIAARVNGPARANTQNISITSTEIKSLNTLLLDLTDWDLVLDSSGNIAMAEQPYSISQDVASAIKTFKGEVWYDTEKGIPYFEQILGNTPPLPLFKEYMINQSLTVPDVVSASVVIKSIDERRLEGQVHFTDVNGNEQIISI
jgi:hypothetical protein